MPNPYGFSDNPYQQNVGPDWMRNQGSPYATMGGQQMAPQMIPGGSSFGDRQAAVGQQLANAGSSGGYSRGGMSGGLGGSALASDPKAMAAGLRKLGDTINPYLPSTQMATAEQYGTNPYSEQSRMLAQQNQGLV